MEQLSELTVYMKYAKYIPELKRRETFKELIDRNKEMHLRKYPHLSEEIEKAYTFVYDKKVLPSMRSLQFGGRAIELNPARMYNCCYAPIDDIAVFKEILFLLLGGTGVGYSVQKHHVDRLPSVVQPTSERRYVVADSIEGWADAIGMLMKCYFKGAPRPIFDFSEVRAKGARIVTSGGKAPGPEPLKNCLEKVEAILKNTDKLTTIQAHDIVCHLADAVLSGGIRRAALISLFSHDDTDMLTAKSGQWWEDNPQRARANNSAILMRGTDESVFRSIMKAAQDSGAGEPGVLWTNSLEWGTNPCLRKGTKVLTTTGIYPIEQLADKMFLAKNIKGNDTLGKCFLSGEGKQLYKITLAGGHEYFATADHEWPTVTRNGVFKKSTDMLVAGDVLPVVRHSSLFASDIGTAEEALSSPDLSKVWLSSEAYRKAAIPKLMERPSENVKELSEILGFYGIRTNITNGTVEVIDQDQYDNVFNGASNNVPKEAEIEVVDVQPTDLYEDVWDIMVSDESHTFQISHCISANCAEIALRSTQFCNLTEVNVSDISEQHELNERVEAATLIGTLQAGYTDFHYLRPQWKQVTEKDALLGVSMTGIASMSKDINLRQASNIAVKTNKRIAEAIGINPAARITTVKPAGTTSLVLGCSSGIHAWHSEYYIRRIRVNKNEAIYSYLKEHHPHMIEDEAFSPLTTAVISFPVKAPQGAITRTESEQDLMERVKRVYTEWVLPSHQHGTNTHNVSATVSVSDWDTTTDWMWENRDYYNGLSVLPYDGGTYVQAPFEEITKEQYEEFMALMKPIDTTLIYEEDDNTTHTDQAACAGGACEIK